MLACVIVLYLCMNICKLREWNASLFSRISKQMLAEDSPNNCTDSVSYRDTHTHLHILLHSGIERKETLRHKNTHLHTPSLWSV